MHIHRVFCLVLSLFTPVFSDEDYFQSAACCTFRGPNFKDTEFILKFGYNQYFMLEYNSTRGNWTGFTPSAIANLSNFNNPLDFALRKYEKTLLCEDTLQLVQSLGDLTTPPIVSVKLVKQPSGHPAKLVCSAYNFYPKQVRMKWLQNKQEVTTGVTYSDVMDDGDLNYQMHLFLEYTLTLGDKITCMVEHVSLSEPKILVWEDSLSAEAQIHIIAGLCVLIFGLVILSSGLIYYKKKSAAHIIFCRGQTVIPLEHLPAAGTEQL
ncbi:rano class II histocompatibility antigen, A beta chain-like [Melanotaenia boesemani]|uniref:rano class II histocompatibility antigen, A beta chain-like n=1 Tax=Melanotaenia boesemani TaxID=1250792 RepID=UPI001C05BA6A|nr:rano class II histocompatibility antigen, A beta chain-like [Melanotaenia boesemani]